jgi:predicted ArsR family transcriptional regulator
VAKSSTCLAPCYGFTIAEVVIFALLSGLSMAFGKSLRSLQMAIPAPSSKTVENANISLQRDVFLRSLIRELAGTLQDVVGINEASGFVSVVGQRIGDQINHEYKLALQTESLTRHQVGEVLVDLKRRIQGDFVILEESDEKIVFGNKKCPFEDKVIGRPSMCMMTSNVFGSIAAQNLGYAKVELQETIAQGASGCRVVVYLKPTEEAQAVSGREYFKGDSIG